MFATIPAGWASKVQQRGAALYGRRQNSRQKSDHGTTHETEKTEFGKQAMRTASQRARSGSSSYLFTLLTQYTLTGFLRAPPQAGGRPAVRRAGNATGSGNTQRDRGQRFSRNSTAKSPPLLPPARPVRRVERQEPHLAAGGSRKPGKRALGFQVEGAQERRPAPGAPALEVRAAPSAHRPIREARSSRRSGSEARTGRPPRRRRRRLSRRPRRAGPPRAANRKGQVRRPATAEREPRRREENRRRAPRSATPPKARRRHRARPRRPAALPGGRVEMNVRSAHEPSAAEGRRPSPPLKRNHDHELTKNFFDDHGPE